VPALRERRDDIDDLVAYFLAEFCARNNVRSKTIDPDVLPLLRRYDWPGNVRELRNAVERMAILTAGDRIPVDAVPLEIQSSGASATSGLQQVRDAAERDRITHALDQTKGNVSQAAKILGIERTHLHKRIRALGVKSSHS
jgi:DNA-binding NtrC family response regulator